MSKKNKKMKKVLKSLTASRAAFGSEIYRTNCRLEELEPTVRDILWFLAEQYGISPVMLLESGRNFGLVHDEGSDGPIMTGPMFTQEMVDKVKVRSDQSQPGIPDVDAPDHGFEDGTKKDSISLTRRRSIAMELNHPFPCTYAQPGDTCTCRGNTD